jgi:hypothetical protein
MTYIITYFLNLFDLIMTLKLVNRYGIGVEANPIGQWLIESGGAVFYKTAVVPVMLALLAFCLQRCPRLAWIRFVPLGVYSILALYHIIIGIL